MTLILELADNKEITLKARALSQGVSAEEYATRVLDRELEQPEIPNTASQRPLSARIRDIWKDMPADERAEYPEGGAYQIDHHVYGLPKG